MTPADLIAERNKIKAHLEAESKRFAEYCAPANARVQEIDNKLLEMLLEQKCDSFKTEHGTAYKSTIITPKVIDKEKFLDFVLEDWDNRGAMLQINAPQKDALTEFMDANNGHLPPFVETSSFTRVNVRKT